MAGHDNLMLTGRSVTPEGTNRSRRPAAGISRLASSAFAFLAPVAIP